MEGLNFRILRYINPRGTCSKEKGKLGQARLDLLSFPFLTLATQATFIYLLLIYFVYIWFVLLFCIFIS